MLQTGLDRAIRDRALSSGIDWRNAWAGAGEHGVVRAWPESAATALGLGLLERGPELQSASVLEPMRSEPRHTAEMISEVRSAERLLGLRHENSWWLVAGEDGYVGWVYDWVLDVADEVGEPPDFRYARPLGTLWVSDHRAAHPLFAGTPLWSPERGLAKRGGHRLVRAANGAEGWIADAELEPAVALADARSLLNLVRGLCGVPYRWGGRSPLGFDCSGLVQFAAQRCGVGLPRDASQQSRCGEPVDPDPAAWEAGDLVFFGDPADHVGFSDGRGGLLHCRGQVRVDRLEDLPRLMDRISAVRRWWGMRGGSWPGSWTARVEPDLA